MWGRLSALSSVTQSHLSQIRSQVHSISKDLLVDADEAASGSENEQEDALNVRDFDNGNFNANLSPNGNIEGARYDAFNKRQYQHQHHETSFPSHPHDSASTQPESKSLSTSKLPYYYPQHSSSSLHAHEHDDELEDEMGIEMNTTATLTDSMYDQTLSILPSASRFPITSYDHHSKTLPVISSNEYVEQVDLGTTSPFSLAENGGLSSIADPSRVQSFPSLTHTFSQHSADQFQYIPSGTSHLHSHPLTPMNNTANNVHPVSQNPVYIRETSEPMSLPPIFSKTEGPIFIAENKSIDDNEDFDERIRIVRMEYENEIEELKRKLLSANASNRSSPMNGHSSQSIPSPLIPNEVRSQRSIEDEKLISKLHEELAQEHLERQRLTLVTEKMKSWKEQVQNALMKLQQEKKESQRILEEMSSELRQTRDNNAALERILNDERSNNSLQLEELSNIRQKFSLTINELEKKSTEVKLLISTVEQKDNAIDTLQRKVTTMEEKLNAFGRERQYRELQEVNIANELERAAERHYAEVQKLGEDKATLQAQLLKSEDSILDLNSSLKALQQSNLKILAQKDEEIKSLLSRLNSAPEEVSTQSTEVTELSQTIETLRSELSTTLNKLQQSSEDNKALKAELESALTKANAHISDANNPKLVSQWQARYTSMEKRFTEMQGECRNLLKRESEYVDQISKLQERLTEIESGKLQKKSGALSLLQDDDDEDDDRIQQLQYDLTAIQSELKAAISEKEQLEQLYNVAQSQLEDLRRKSKEQLEAFSRERSTFNLQLQQLTQDTSNVESISATLALLQQENDHARSELVNCRDELNATQTALEEERTAHHELVQHLDRQRNELQVRVKEAESATNSYKQLQSEVQALTTSIHSLREQFLAVQKHASKLETDNQKLRQALDQSARQLQRVNTDTDEVLNRRVVIQVLFAYFERDQNDDVFALLCRLIGLAPEEKQRLTAARTKRSIGGQVKRIASFFSPFDSESNSSTNLTPILENPNANVSLADMWAEFLLQETTKSENQRLRTSSTPASAPSTPLGGLNHLATDPQPRSHLFTPQPHAPSSNQHPTASSFTISNHDRPLNPIDSMSAPRFLNHHPQAISSSPSTIPPLHSNSRTATAGLSNPQNFPPTFNHIPLPSFPTRNSSHPR